MGPKTKIICVTVSSICENHHYGSANMVAKKKKGEKLGRNNLLGNYVVTPMNGPWAGNVVSIQVGFLYENILSKYKNLCLLLYIQKIKYIIPCTENNLNNNELITSSYSFRHGTRIVNYQIFCGAIAGLRVL